VNDVEGVHVRHSLHHLQHHVEELWPVP
jgi:hypothetical protein